MTKGAVPIPKASNKEHVLESVDSCGWILLHKEMAAVDSFFIGRGAMPLARLGAPAIKVYGALSKISTLMARRRRSGEGRAQSSFIDS